MSYAVTVATPFGPHVREFDTYGEADDYYRSLNDRTKLTAHLQVLV